MYKNNYFKFERDCDFRIGFYKRQEKIAENYISLTDFLAVYAFCLLKRCIPFINCYIAPPVLTFIRGKNDCKH